MSYAIGYWCKVCEFFEDGDNFEDSQCLACGCLEHAHVFAKVVDA